MTQLIGLIILRAAGDFNNNVLSKVGTSDGLANVRIQPSAGLNKLSMAL